MNQASRRLPALLAAAGLLFSVVLEVVHVRAYLDPSTSSFCSAGAAADCGSVALSRYSVAVGIPVPVWGIVGSAVLLVAAVRNSWMLLPLSAFAALASVALLAIELVAIRSVCLFCEAVHVLSWALFYVVYRRRAELNAPSREEWINVGIVSAVVLVGARLFTPPYWALYSWRAGVHLPNGVQEDGNRWIGAESPKVTVHEYVDYGCPHCALSASRLRRLLASNASTLRVVRHPYPRMSCPKEPNPYSCNYTRAALCAGDQGRFWQMDSWLFEHAPGKAKVDFDEAVRDVGLDAAKFKGCFDSPATMARADAANDDARKARIIDTPTYVINGKRYSTNDAFAELRSAL